MINKHSKQSARLKAAPVTNMLTVSCSRGEHSSCFSQKCSCKCHIEQQLELKKFDIHRAQFLPDKIVTRSGMIVSNFRIEFDMLSGYVRNGQTYQRIEWFLDGRYYANRKESPFDLFMEM